MRLLQSERNILTVLELDGRATVAALRRRVPGYGRGNARSEAGELTYKLNNLAGHGLCKRMDDRKPIAWGLTKWGAQKLGEG